MMFKCNVQSSNLLTTRCATTNRHLAVVALYLIEKRNYNIVSDTYFPAFHLICDVPLPQRLKEWLKFHNNFIISSKARRDCSSFGLAINMADRLYQKAKYRVLRNVLCFRGLLDPTTSYHVYKIHFVVSLIILFCKM